MAPRPLDRLRRLCLALPQAEEKLAWGTPTFRVRNKLFAMYANPTTHAGSGRPGVWLHASKENQLLMVAHRPELFFVPPYVGPSGWVGVWLDAEALDWDELAILARDAWERVAPKSLLKPDSSATVKGTQAKPTKATKGAKASTRAKPAKPTTRAKPTKR